MNKSQVKSKQPNIYILNKTKIIYKTKRKRNL